METNVREMENGEKKGNEGEYENWIRELNYFVKKKGVANGLLS